MYCTFPVDHDPMIAVDKDIQYQPPFTERVPDIELRYCLATPLLRCCAPFGAPRRRDLLLPPRLGRSARRYDAVCRMRADGEPFDDGGARETSLLVAASGALARSAEERVTPQERCYE
jgi:hypothetical protein